MARILIVDDDTVLCELLAQQLQQHGHKVRTAHDALMGLRLLLEAPVDVVLTDIEMPYMDGIEFAFAIRAQPETRHLPIVFLTGRSDDSTWKQAKFLGGHYVSKAVGTGEVLAAIEAATELGAFALGGATLTPDHSMAHAHRGGR